MRKLFQRLCLWEMRVQSLQRSKSLMRTFQNHLRGPEAVNRGGMGSTYPEVPREIKPGRGGILIGSAADSETALGQKLERLGCGACLLKHGLGKVRE